MSTWVLIVVTMAYGYAGSQHPTVAMQEFTTQRACGIAADYVREQMRVQSKQQAGLTAPTFDARCMQKWVAQ